MTSEEHIARLKPLAFRDYRADIGLGESIAWALTEIAEYEQSFNLRWNADMRAIKRWQEATGRNLIWPDHADLCVWVLGRMDEQDAEIHVYTEQLEELRVKVAQQKRLYEMTLDNEARWMRKTDEQEAEIKRLREVLRPFAEADLHPSPWVIPRKAFAAARAELERK